MLALQMERLEMRARGMALHLGLGRQAQVPLGLLLVSSGLEPARHPGSGADCPAP